MHCEAEDEDRVGHIDAAAAMIRVLLRRSEGAPAATAVFGDEAAEDVCPIFIERAREDDPVLAFEIRSVSVGNKISGVFIGKLQLHIPPGFPTVEAAEDLEIKAAIIGVAVFAQKSSVRR